MNGVVQFLTTKTYCFILLFRERSVRSVILIYSTRLLYEMIRFVVQTRVLAIHQKVSQGRVIQFVGAGERRGSDSNDNQWTWL